MRTSTEFKGIPKQSEIKLQVDAYWARRGMKRTFLACCDCDLDYCSGKDSGCFGIVWRRKKQEIGVEILRANYAKLRRELDDAKGVIR